MGSQHEHQNTLTTAEDIIRAPYPESFSEEQIEQLHLLRENKAEYGEVIEDEIARDGLVQALLQKRKEVGEGREIVPTVRLRRTVVAAAYILEHTKSVESLPTKHAARKSRSKTAAA